VLFVDVSVRVGQICRHMSNSDRALSQLVIDESTVIGMNYVSMTCASRTLTVTHIHKVYTTQTHFSNYCTTCPLGELSAMAD